MQPRAWGLGPSASSPPPPPPQTRTLGFTQAQVPVDLRRSHELGEGKPATPYAEGGQEQSAWFSSMLFASG